MNESAGGSTLVSLKGEGLSLRMRNEVEALEPGRLAVRTFLLQCEVGERTVYDADLVLEEIFTNTVRYGYIDHRPHYIELTVSLCDDTVVMTFDDDARAFDPTLAQEPVLPKSISDTKIGGLGLMLVRKAAGAIEYRRENGRNTLRISMRA